MKKILFSSILLMGLTLAKAQTADSLQAPKVTFSGYTEIFYNYDFSEPENHIRQPFLYTYNRHNEVNLNLGLAKAHYETENMRANFALMAGTYVQDNMAAEQGALKHVNEANVGFKIFKDKNVWIDAGILPSHIGWESAVGKDNLTLTRSFAAENSPYFETGAKISYTSSDGKWFLSGLVLNGWQRIARVEGNQTLGFGHQLTYSPNSKFSINSSSFIGNDKPQAEKKMRYFHNLYATLKPTEKFTAILGFDIGAEQKEKGSDAYNIWYTPNVLAKYQMTEKTGIGARVEYFSDKNGVIISTGTPGGFQTVGYSLNIDHQIHNNILWRTEARGLSSKDKIFIQDGDATAGNFSITTGLSAWF